MKKTVIGLLGLSLVLTSSVPAYGMWSRLGSAKRFASSQVKNFASRFWSPGWNKSIPRSYNAWAGWKKKLYPVAGSSTLAAGLSRLAVSSWSSEQRDEKDVTLQKALPQEAIAEALQSEAVFTRASDSKYAVATYGCGPCVAVGGYDETNQFAFVVHFANEDEVRKCGGVIFYNLLLLTEKPLKTPIQLHLRGGLSGRSEGTIEAIKIWMHQRSDLPMEIVSEDVLDEDVLDTGTLFKGKSILINSKTGEVGEYDPMLNPQHRTLDEMATMHALLSAHHPNIKVAYKPHLKHCKRK